MSDNILKDQGFEREIGGGGCVILSRYMESGGFAWATDRLGGGLPEQSDWLICAYGDNIDNIIFEANSYDGGGLSLEQAAVKACDIAASFQSEFELCRNGVSFTDCDCC
jgi:hypothetical protein